MRGLPAYWLANSPPPHVGSSLLGPLMRSTLTGFASSAKNSRHSSPPPSMRYRAWASVLLTASGELADWFRQHNCVERSTFTNRFGHSIWPREGRSFQPRRHVQLLRQLVSSVDACRSSLHRCVDAAMHQRSTSDSFLGASGGHATPSAPRRIRHACPGTMHRVSASSHGSTWSRSYSSSLRSGCESPP